MQCHGASDNIVACSRVFLSTFSCKFYGMACTVDLNEMGYPPGFDTPFWRECCGAAFCVWACTLTLKLRRRSALPLRLDVLERMTRLRVDMKLLRAAI